MDMRENGQRAWSGVVREPLGGRRQKPRDRGLTMVIDKGMGISATREFVQMTASYADIVKLSFGTSALYSEDTLRLKLELLRDAGISVSPGGTFAEVAIAQERLSEYLDYAQQMGFDAIEISDGCIDLDQDVRVRAIRSAKRRDFLVISEVGKKHPSDGVPAEELGHQMVRDLACGADYVILEARESGQGVTIFDASGRVRIPDLRAITGIVDGWMKSVIWEAPRPKQQKEFVLRFGPNVNLGNVAPSEVLALEALRVGLRGDTLREQVLRERE